MNRRPSTQDLTWLLDLNKNNQLDLEPPYQRRSVWTRGDRQFFLDTIFRNYPCPAIFLHKTIDDGGRATYHVVDGKQRTQTILDFVEDRIRIASDFGDVRLNGKKWSELHGEQDLKQKFWNYQITVEMIDVVEGTVVNEVFDRLNRNSRRLTSQELRHAKFGGWFINQVETESTREEWRTLGIATTARMKRMVDSQFISELMLVILEGRVLGFDQDLIDDLYAKYDDPNVETLTEFSEEAFTQRFTATRQYLVSIAATVVTYAKGFGDFYTLWAALALSTNLPPADSVAMRYTTFMEKVQKLAKTLDLEAFLQQAQPGQYTLALDYFNNSRGASTDLAPRTARFNALRTVLLG